MDDRIVFHLLFGVVFCTTIAAGTAWVIRQGPATVIGMIAVGGEEKPSAILAAANAATHHQCLHEVKFQKGLQALGGDHLANGKASRLDFTRLEGDDGRVIEAVDVPHRVANGIRNHFLRPRVGVEGVQSGGEILAVQFFSAIRKRSTNQNMV